MTQTPVVVEEQHHASVERARRSGVLLERYWIVLVLGAIVLGFSLVNPENFPTVANARNVALDSSMILVLAAGATFVLITGGIDLSVGSVLVFSSVVGAKVIGGTDGAGWGPVLLALGVCLASGLMWGIFNGLLIAYLNLSALIATLATLGIALGLAEVITQGVDVRIDAPKLSDLGLGRLAGEVPYLVLAALAVALLLGLLLALTRFGRYTYAIGSNDEAARRAGLNVRLHLLKVYALAGSLSGLAGFIDLARFSTTNISTHNSDILHVVTGVVLGGTSLFGGVGTMFGTVIGVTIPGVLENGFVISGVQPFWQQVAVGVVLILAVYVDQLRRSRRPA